MDNSYLQQLYQIQQGSGATDPEELTGTLSFAQPLKAIQSQAQTQQGQSFQGAGWNPGQAGPTGASWNPSVTQSQDITGIHSAVNGGGGWWNLGGSNRLVYDAPIKETVGEFADAPAAAGYRLYNTNQPSFLSQLATGFAPIASVLAAGLSGGGALQTLGSIGAKAGMNAMAPQSRAGQSPLIDLLMASLLKGGR